MEQRAAEREREEEENTRRTHHITYTDGDGAAAILNPPHSLHHSNTHTHTRPQRELTRLA
eukprot:m.96641 g.96641  ORF g.96641 m.96641 type:complete len:60 (+) comp15495_c3_seq6:258-437(+)